MAKTAPGPATASRPRRVPQRTCVACRSSDAKRVLIRLVRATADGRVVIDTTGKQAGRGAYLCHNPECWNTALQRRSLERALRIERLHPDDRTQIKQFAQQLEGTMVDE
ncbi:MAG: YlxR family protein [Chloroflexaceae bacterium]|nr:YlxR family protein [Chloroflexaceae bacterium]NJO08041.1 YlxR family protein [Chloroflexaceae bacterium]